MKPLFYCLCLLIISFKCVAGNDFAMVTHTFQKHPVYPNTYLVVLEAVMPCSTAIVPDSISVNCEWGGAMTFSSTRKLPKIVSNILPNNLDTSMQTTCQSLSSTIPGFKVITYVDTVKAMGYLISVTYKDCPRVTFTNINTACVANRMVKNVESNQESNIGSTRVLYLYEDSFMHYNLNVSDLEGDSTSIILVTPADTMQTYGLPLLYKPAIYNLSFSMAEPMGFGSSAAIADTFLDINSGAPGVYLLTAEVTDFDTTFASPILLSSALNDFIVIVLPSVPVGISTAELSAIQVQPNPIMGDLHVVGLYERDRVQIFNYLGQVVHDKEYSNSGAGKIDFSEMPKGLYVLKVFRGARFQCVNFVK